MPHSNLADGLKGVKPPSTLNSMFRNIILLMHILRQRFFNFLFLFFYFFFLQTEGLFRCCGRHEKRKRTQYFKSENKLILVVSKIYPHYRVKLICAKFHFLSAFFWAPSSTVSFLREPLPPGRYWKYLTLSVLS